MLCIHWPYSWCWKFFLKNEASETMEPLLLSDTLNPLAACDIHLHCQLASLAGLAITEESHLWLCLQGSFCNEKGKPYLNAGYTIPWAEIWTELKWEKRESRMSHSIQPTLIPSCEHRLTSHPSCCAIPFLCDGFCLLNLGTRIYLPSLALLHSGMTSQQGGK